MDMESGKISSDTKKSLRQCIQKSGRDKATCDPQEVRTVDPLLASVCVGVVGGAVVRHIQEKSDLRMFTKNIKMNIFVASFFLSAKLVVASFPAGIKFRRKPKK